jgi:Secretion system C-terminal sorting domain
VFVRPVPSKPIISKEEQPDKFILTTSSVEANQWFLNGTAISGATAQTYIPQEVGVYSVSTTKDQCSNVSEPMTVKLEKPIITYNGSTAFFEGDSLLLVAPMGYSQYNWTVDDKPFSSNQQKVIARKSGSYRVSTQRGKMVSEFSEPVPIAVSPILAIMPTPTLSIKLYPNPNKGVFWVELPENSGKWQMEVFDIQGRQVLRKKHISGLKNRESMEIKSPSGIYFLKVSNNDLIRIIKFVVE